MDTAEAVLKFLRSVGPRTEAEFYLELFRSAPRERFATLVVDEQTMAESADAVAVDLRFLAQLELTPIVVLRGDQPQTAQQSASDLMRRLHVQGVVAQGPLSTREVETITTAARNGVIAVCVDEGPDDDPMARLSVLLSALQAHKLIFVRQAGGLRLEGERLSLVDLGAETDSLLAGDSLSQVDKQLLLTARMLVSPQAEHKLLVSVTSPLNLLHELFTVRGAGTLLRWAATITRHQGLTGVDLTKLVEILEASFGRKPARDVLQRDYADCYMDSAYRGAALLIQSPFGGYLSKFAVTRKAQGEGVGRDLWRAVSTDYERLLWRARANNPISSWYEQQCQSLYRIGAWTIYTRGIDASELPAAIAFVQSQPDDFSSDETLL